MFYMKSFQLYLFALCGCISGVGFSKMPTKVYSESNIFLSSIAFEKLTNLDKIKYAQNVRRAYSDFEMNLSRELDISISRNIWQQALLPNEALAMGWTGTSCPVGGQEVKIIGGKCSTTGFPCTDEKRHVTDGFKCGEIWGVCVARKPVQSITSRCFSQAATIKADNASGIVKNAEHLYASHCTGANSGHIGCKKLKVSLEKSKKGLKPVAQESGKSDSTQKIVKNPDQTVTAVQKDQESLESNSKVVVIKNCVPLNTESDCENGVWGLDTNSNRPVECSDNKFRNDGISKIQWLYYVRSMDSNGTEKSFEYIKALSGQNDLKSTLKYYLNQKSKFLSVSFKNVQEASVIIEKYNQTKFKNYCAKRISPPKENPQPVNSAGALLPDTKSQEGNH